MNDTQGRHNAILENRQRLQLSGVTDVDSFDKAFHTAWRADDKRQRPAHKRNKR